VLSADANGLGKGGTVVAWSDGVTQFAGSIFARGGEAGGDGGVVETSGLEGLGVEGSVDASARAAYGRNGSWLLDPKNITIGTVTDPFSEFERIVLDSSGGGYPVDNTPSPGLGPRFGASVDLEGSTLVVGVGGFFDQAFNVGGPNNDGAAYVFENGGIAARLSSPEGSAAFSFGSKVAITNDVIGVLDPSFPSGEFRGALYTFAKGTGWRNGTANLSGTARNPQANDFTFGRALAAANGVFYVGAPGFDVGNSADMGAVHRIYNGGSIWTLTPDTYYQGNQGYFDSLPSAGFGSHIAASGDWFYVGWDGSSGRSNSYWYANTATGAVGVATPQSEALASGEYSGFLNAFAADGNVLAVNAGRSVNLYGYHDNGSNYTVYTENNSILSIEFDDGVLMVADRGYMAAAGFQISNRVSFYYPAGLQKFFEIVDPSEYFGISLALEGGFAAIGSYEGAARPQDVGNRIGTVTWLTSDNPDSAFSGWNGTYQSSILGPAIADISSIFGRDVAVDGNTIAIGDPYVGDQRYADNYGAVYIYEDNALAAVLESGLVSSDIHLRFGYSVDLDGTTLATINYAPSGASHMHVFERGAGWTNGYGNRTGLYASPTAQSFEDVAIDDDLVAVTTRFSSDQVNVLFFGRNGTTWQNTLSSGPDRTATVRTSGAGSFASLLELDGNTLVVSAPTSNPDNELVVFENLANNWSTAVQTTLSVVGVSDLGFDFDVSGDTIVAGSLNASTAYVFERTTDWASVVSPAATLMVDGMTNFGRSVAVDDGTVVVYGRDAGGRESFAFFDRQNGWNDGTVNLVSTFAADIGGTHLIQTLDLSGDTLVAGLNGTSTYPRHALVLNGPFDLSARNTYALGASASINIAATALANSLSLGTDITLQANNDIRITSAVLVDNPFDDGGNLTLTAGRSILINASIDTDNGDLTLLADDPNANQTYRDGGEAVVVLGENVELTLGTGDLFINAADRFENRTGSTSPFSFDATNPGTFLIYAQTPENTGAPDLANLGNDMDVVGRDFVYYGVSYNSADSRPSFLPTGSGFVYAIAPSVTVGVGNSTITYGQNPSASLSLEGILLDGNPVADTSLFGITSSDLLHLVDASVDPTIPVASSGFPNAGFYAGAVTAVAKDTITSGGVYGVSVTTGAAGDLTVNKAVLAVVPEDATRAYRTEDPEFTAVYSGFVAGDSVVDLDEGVNVSSGATPTSDVGSYLLTATGGSDNNYTFNPAGTGLLTITPKDVTITGLSGVDKVYDATTTAEFSGAPTIDTAAVDGVMLGGTLTATASFADANVGDDKTLSFSGFTLTGNAAKIGNYNLVLPTNVTASITPYALIVSGFSAVDRVYDATILAEITGTPSVDAFAGDEVLIAGTATGTFADKNVGADKPVALGGLTLGGADAGNYTFSTDAGLTADITPRELVVVGVAAQDRIYDATTHATLSGTPFAQAIPGDELSVAGAPTAFFADKNVGAAKPVTVVGYSFDGADAANYAIVQPQGLNADITPADLAVTGLTGADRVYDATTDASLVGSPTIAPLGHDELSLTGTATASFASKTAEADKPITVTGYSLAGADAPNYTLIAPSGITATISPRPLTISDFIVNSRVYDATTQATTTGAESFTGILPGDVAFVDVSNMSLNFHDKNVGADKPVTVQGVSVVGPDGANYVVSFETAPMADITPAALSITGATTQNRIYDATTNVVVTGGNLLGVLGSDAVNLDGSAAAAFMADKNFGLDKAVTVLGYTASGSDAGNYVLFQPTGLTVDIAAFALNLSGLSGDKVYDGTVQAPLSVAGLDAVFAGDDVAADLSGATGVYADKNAGTGKAITLSGSFGLMGNDATNYTLNQPVSLSGDIARLGITVSGLTIADKTYDGTTAGEISGTGTFGGVIPGDDLSIDVGDITVTFADKNAGPNKPVALSGVTLAGADASNYTAATPQGIAATIFPKTIDLTGLTADDRTYDRTTVATLSGVAGLEGVVAGDDVAPDNAALLASFSDKHVGNDKVVTLAGAALTGFDAPNYALQVPTLSASITAAVVEVVGLSAQSRIYDATIVAGLNGTAGLDFGILSGVNDSAEDIALAGVPTASFPDQNVGEAKAVTVADLTLTGADAANYSLVVPTLTADITPAELTVTGTTVADRVYDGTEIANPAELGTVTPLANDEVVLGGTLMALFEDKNVGSDKPVIVGGYELSGADAGNYVVIEPTDVTASISPATLTVAGTTAADRIYDATTLVAVAGGSVVGVFSPDDVSLDASTISGTIADKNVGTAKPVAIAGYTLIGADAGNYILEQPTDVTVDIAAFILGLVGLTADKTYDGSTIAPLRFTELDAVFAGDAVAVDAAAVTAAYADKNAGSEKPVTIAGDFVLTGSDAANYTLTQPTGLLGTIARLGITVSGLTIADKVYDGTVAGEISGTGTFGGVIAGDEVMMDVGEIEITFADRNAGENKAVALSGVTLTGAAAANYDAATPQGISATIFPKEVTATGLVAGDKVYDRTTVAELSGAAAVEGLIVGDSVALDASAQAGEFADKNVSDDKTVTVSGLALTGDDAANYTLLVPELSASITRATVNLVGLAAQDRIYNATVEAALAGTVALDFGALNGVLEDDEDLGLSGTMIATFDDKNVGSGKNVTLSGANISGADAGNYTLVVPALEADITPANLVISGTTALSRIYDTTTEVTLSSLGTVAPLGSDEVSIASLSAAFADRHAGDDKPVLVSGGTLSGADAGNYTLVLPSNVSATISPADLALTGVIADDRIYDGTLSVPLSGALSVAPLGNDVVTVAGRPSATFGDKNVGVEKPVTLAGLSLTGADAGNYRLILPELFSDVFVRSVDLLGLVAEDKIYDGTTLATINGPVSFGNAIAGDDLQFDVSALSAEFDSANVGTARRVSLEGFGLRGADAGNYSQVLPSGLTAAIVPRLLAIVGVSAADRIYDATADVDVSGGALEGLVGADQVTPQTASAVGTMEDKNVGLEKPVTVSGYTISGEAAGNYTVSQPTDVTVDITPLELSVSGLEIADKFFDGTTTATATGGQLQGFISGDDVSLDRSGQEANFIDSDVGEDKIVQVTGLAVGGADGGNYTLPPSLEVSGTILATLETITDVVPVEVLQATAAAEREAARRALEEVANATQDTVEMIDYEAANTQLLSGVAGAPLDQDAFAIPADQRDPTVDAYIKAAYAADAAVTAYNQEVAVMRSASREFKALSQEYNAAVREAMVAEGLQSTLQQELATIESELNTIDDNLNAIATAKASIAEYRQRIAAAMRLGRGNEVEALEAMIAEAEAIVASEDAVLAQRDALLAARTESEQRLEESAAVIARSGELAAQYDSAKTALDRQKASVATARSQAQAAVAATEEARAAGEAKARELLAQAERSREFWESEADSSLDATVEAVLANFDENGRASDGSFVSDRYPLSTERQAQIAEKRAEFDSLIQQYDSLQAQENAAQQKFDSLESEVRYATQRELITRGLSEASSEELAQLDPRDLGITDETLLPTSSAEIRNLESATNTLEDALRGVGKIKIMGGLGGKLELRAPGNVAANSYRGLNDIDSPTTLDPVFEQAVKAEMQTFGLLPKFNNPALDQLPVATQLQLQAGMKAAAARQAELVAQGMDPNEAAQAALDDKTMELVTMALFEKFDTYGIGDVPGVQAFVGEALGELSVQFGVSPGAMTANLVNGDFGGLMGDAGDAVVQVGARATAIVTDPVGAGVELVEDVGGAIASGASAAFNAWTGGGGGGGGDEAAQRRAYEAYVAERTEALSALGGALVQVENTRLEAVAAREAAFVEVGEAIVAQAQAREAREERVAMGTRRSLEAAREETLASLQSDLQREEIADAVRPNVEAQQAREAENLAQAEALVQRQQALLNAFTENGGEG
jgi:hypothetical protein